VSKPLISRKNFFCTVGYT